MIKIRKALTADLKPFYKPDEVIGYCKECNNYGQIWSCPPHDFNMEKYVNEFKFAYIIRIKIDIKNIESEKVSIEKFHKIRKKFNSGLLALESEFTGTKVLYSGECHFCKECSRKNGKECIDRSKIRYSLESLGFNVADICEKFLDEKLNWKNSIKPDYLFSIGAVLTNSELKIPLNRFI